MARELSWVLRNVDCTSKAPGEPGDTMNLSQKVPFAPPIPGEGPAEEDKSIPEWSEKVAHGILTGESEGQNAVSSS